MSGCVVFERQAVWVQRCNSLAESHSLLKADKPELIAGHAIPFDRIATIEQPQQVRHGQAILRLLAFARSPGSDIWVWFGDLPDEVAKELWKMHSSKLAFPAGLPLYPRGGA